MSHSADSILYGDSPFSAPNPQVSPARARGSSVSLTAGDVWEILRCLRSAPDADEEALQQLAAWADMPEIAEQALWSDDEAVWQRFQAACPVELRLPREWPGWAPASHSLQWQGQYPGRHQRSALTLHERLLSDLPELG